MISPRMGVSGPVLWRSSCSVARPPTGPFVFREGTRLRRLVWPRLCFVFLICRFLFVCICVPPVTRGILPTPSRLRCFAEHNKRRPRARACTRSQNLAGCGVVELWLRPSLLEASPPSRRRRRSTSTSTSTTWRRRCATREWGGGLVATHGPKQGHMDPFATCGAHEGFCRGFQRPESSGRLDPWGVPLRIL